MNRKLFLASLLLLATAPASSAAPRKVSFRTLCIERAEGLDKVIVPVAGKKAKPQEIALYTDISPVIDGSFLSDEAVFYKGIPEGGAKPVAVGKARMGKSSRQLFVFIKNEGGEDEMPYRVLAFDDDEKSFPLGHVRAINLASVPVKYTVADNELPEIAAGGSTQIPHPKQVNEYNLYPVSVLYKNAQGGWTQGGTSNWKASEKTRQVAVTNDSAADKTLTVRIYSDIPPWKK